MSKLKVTTVHTIDGPEAELSIGGHIVGSLPVNENAYDTNADDAADRAIAEFLREKLFGVSP